MTIADHIRLTYVHSGFEFAVGQIVDRAEDVEPDGTTWVFPDGSRIALYDSGILVLSPVELRPEWMG